jgi:hypothetical protein
LELAHVLGLSTVQALTSEESALLAARRESLLAVEALAAILMSEMQYRGRHWLLVMKHTKKS